MDNKDDGCEMVSRRKYVLSRRTPSGQNECNRPYLRLFVVWRWTQLTRRKCVSATSSRTPSGLLYVCLFRGTFQCETVPNAMQLESHSQTESDSTIMVQFVDDRLCHKYDIRCCNHSI